MRAAHLGKNLHSVYGGLSCIRQSWRSHYRVTKRNFVHVGLGVHSHAFTPSIQPTRNSLTTTQNSRPDRWCLRLHRRDHICLVTDFHPRPACTDLQIGCLIFHEILLLLQITISLRNWQLGCAGPWGQDPWLMQRPSSTLLFFLHIHTHAPKYMSLCFIRRRVTRRDPGSRLELDRSLILHMFVFSDIAPHALPLQMSTAPISQVQGLAQWPMFRRCTHMPIRPHDSLLVFESNCVYSRV